MPSGKTADVMEPSAAGRTRRGKMVTRLFKTVPVLMYHGVGTVDEDPFSLFVSPRRFRQQMWALRLLGLRGVSLGDLGDAVSHHQADGLVGLTFDDGYRDVFSSVTPVLERHGYRATMFVVSGLLGGENVWDPPPRRQLITADEVRELARRGWEIGAHGVMHAALTELDSDQLHHEVFASRATLADVTGAEPRCFCYPYGFVNAAAVDAVRDAGYSYACAVPRIPGLSETLAIPRVGVAQRDKMLRFVARIFLRGR